MQIRIKTPQFWSEKGLLPDIFVVLSLWYFLFLRLKNLFSSKPEKMSVPVICVGNITSGGAGKTPTAIAIAELLKKHKKKPVFVSRGYGGNIKIATKVDVAKHCSKDVGDEPLLLAKTANCYVARNRVEGAKMAIADGANVIILDDGMQNNSIHKDLSINVIDGGFGFGNMYVLPAGPLRDSFKLAIKKVDISLIIGDDRKNIKQLLPKDMPVLKAQIHADEKIKPQKNTKYLAFAAIGRPEKFFETLNENNFPVKEEIEYPDHYQYKKHDIEELELISRELDLQLITTEKDGVKFDAEFHKKLVILPIKVKFEDEKALYERIKECFS